jgi:hypothetical protein
MKNSSKGLSLDMPPFGRIGQRLAVLLAMIAVLCGGALLLIAPAHAQEPLERLPFAQNAPISSQPPLSITHSISQTVQVGNSDACRSTQGGYTQQNSFWRVFDLNGEFGIVDLYTVQEVVFGVDNTTGIFDVNVRAYSLEGAFTLENLTLLSQATIQLDNASNGTLVTIDLPDATISPQLDLVIEVDVPNGQAQPANFFPASNDLGQTDLSYLSAPACGFAEPTDLSLLGLPNMHLVIVVNGETGSPTAVTLSDFNSRTAPVILYAAFAGSALVLAGAMWLVFKRRKANLST